MSAAALLAKGAELLSKVPPSTLGSVLQALTAIVNGEPTKAERLAANAARAVAAKAAAKARIRASK